jgi:hypothetical protein
MQNISEKFLVTGREKQYNNESVPENSGNNRGSA